MINLNDFKNIFLDRDGIVNQVIEREGIISSPRAIGEFFLREDFLDFSKKISNRKNIFLVTNQPDISRKLLDKEILKIMHSKISSIIDLKEIAVCPHDNHHNCDCRKPKPGMINKLIEKHKLLRSESILIGDSIKDLLAAERANIEFILLRTNYNQEVSAKFSVNSLTELV